MRRSLPLPALVGLLITGSLITACDGNDGHQGDDGRLDAVASTTIVADWVAHVGGEHVHVTSLVPRSSDTHSYVLVPGDIQRVAAADAVFMIGESLESSFEDGVIENARGPVVKLAEGLDLRPFPEGLAHADEGEQHEEQHDHGDHDPHIFMDVDLAIAAVEHIRDTLTEEDPDNRAAYADNAAAYIETLHEVDDEIRAELSNLPQNRRYIVTFHDAYGYFAARYGLELLGFVVESPEEHPSAGAIAGLIDAIHEHDVHYVFTEPQFDSRVIDQIAADAGVEVRVIPSDALADAYPDYVSLLRAIADGIAR